VRVIAWGLSLERPAMIKYQARPVSTLAIRVVCLTCECVQLKDIRKLCGHGQDVVMIRRNPICRLDS
jgi:hypothetical protein